MVVTLITSQIPLVQEPKSRKIRVVSPRFSNILMVHAYGLESKSKTANYLGEYKIFIKNIRNSSYLIHFRFCPL